MQSLPSDFIQRDALLNGSGKQRIIIILDMPENVLKRSLANLVKRDIGQLTALAKTRLKRMQYRPGLLDGFLAGTGLELIPFSNPGSKARLAVTLAHFRLRCFGIRTG